MQPRSPQRFGATRISFATVYASLVSLVYVTWLFVVEPHVLNGTRVKVELLVFKPGSFMQMVDGSAIPSWVSPHCSRRRASPGQA